MMNESDNHDSTSETGQTDLENDSASNTESQESRKWQPLSSAQRRVLGVLIEKAKTTPDAYPMTLNAITAGCNQKSNRDPVMNLKADLVEEVLDSLRTMGAVAEVHGSGRVAKYRHYGYEWLGVDKHEIAIMTELMLRGEQTLGDLRARASRMEKFDSLASLKEKVDDLTTRGLMLPVTPPGRGQVVTHGLFLQKEKDSMTFADPSDWRDQPAERSSSPPSEPNYESAASGAGLGSGGPLARIQESAGMQEQASLIQELETKIDSLTEQLSEALEQVRQLNSRVEQIETLIQ